MEEIRSEQESHKTSCGSVYPLNDLTQMSQILRTREPQWMSLFMHQVDVYLVIGIHEVKNRGLRGTKPERMHC